MRGSLLAIALLVGLSAKISYTDETECKTTSPFGKLQTAVVLSDEILKAQSRMKTNLQVDHWVGCFALSRAYHNKFLTDYRPMLERAANAYGIPYAFLTCLFFTESKWNRNAVSGAGAIGIAQLMPEPTLPELNELVASTDQTKALDKRLATHKAEMKRRKIKPDAPEYKAGLAILEAEYELNEARMRASKGWQSYWSGKKPPKKLAKDDLKNAERSIGAGAMYLKYILLKYDFDGIGPLSRLLIAAGAYNKGPAGMFRVYAKAKRNYTAVIEALKKQPTTETADHMENVRLCLEKGLWKPGDDKDPRKCKSI